MMRLIVWALLAYLVAMMLMLVFPALLALVALCVLISKRHPDWAGKQLRGLGNLNGKAWESGFVVLSHAIVIGFGAKLALGSLGDIAGGHEMLAGMMTFLLAAGAAGGGMWLFTKILNGDFESMKNIFDLVDNAPAFRDFTENKQQASVVLDIVPERDIPIIKNQVIGQDAVVESVVQTLARRVRQNRKNKPLGVFMFVGATGAGKTELAKAIADTCFEGRMIRVDMNECTDAAGITRLIGPPPGYMGSDKGGQVTGDIKRMRSGVILFDEIEKAHPDFFKAMMGLLDEGRLTDQSFNWTADASQFIIIMTSNAEHQKLGQLAATIEDADTLATAVKDTLQTVFKPEQLARVDEIFCYRPLSRESLAMIVGKFLLKFAKDAQVELVSVSHELLISLIMKFEKRADYGIRELVRLVEKQVVDGMYDRRDEGFKKVALAFDGENVEVRGVPEGQNTASVIRAEEARI